MKLKLAIFASCLLISACSKTPTPPQQTPSPATSENTTTINDNAPSSDASQSNSTTTQQQPTIPNSPTLTQSINISDEEAKQIALNQMQGTITEFSRDFDERIPKYEISVVNGDMEYEYEISAIDGAIIGYSVESIYN